MLQVLRIIQPHWKCGAAFMAKEFLEHNDKRTRNAFVRACRGLELRFESHAEFKQRVPRAVGLIRTGDATIYGNLILVSA